MLNWDEETEQGPQEVASQRNARIWSVNYLFDSFNFLIDYVIYIPRQTQLLVRGFTPFYTTYRTAIRWRGDDIDTPSRVPRCQLV